MPASAHHATASSGGHNTLAVFSWRWWVLLMALFLALTAWSARQIDGSSIKADATQNLKIAYHLFHSGVFAMNSDPVSGQPLPTNFREPVPPAFTAAYLRLVLPTAEPHDFRSWHFGEHTRLVKLGNLFWVFAGLVGFQWLAARLMGGRLWALAATALAYVFFFHNVYIVNSLYTELPAGTLMIWSCALLVVGLQKPDWRWWAAAGLALGALALTKSVFQTAAPAAVLCVLLAWVWHATQAGAWRVALWRMALPLFATFALVITPWMLRNQLQLHTADISSGRSGYVMYKRSLMDHMNADEFRLAFQLYGPPIFKRWVEGTDWAMVYPEDAMRGGRLQRLNPYHSDFQDEDNRSIHEGKPENSFTFYRQAAAAYQKVRNELQASGHPDADLEADRILRHQALSAMLASPLEHAKVSVLVLWRSFWWAPGDLPTPMPGAPKLNTAVAQWSNLAAGLALFLVFGAAAVRRWPIWLALTALPVCMILLHALLTQGLPRFNTPAIPFMVLALVACVRAAALQGPWRRRGKIAA
jgi:hypothetical protein